MYLCVCIYMYICMHLCMYVCMCIYIYVCMYVCRWSESLEKWKNFFTNYAYIHPVQSSHSNEFEATNPLVLGAHLIVVYICMYVGLYVCSRILRKHSKNICMYVCMYVSLYIYHSSFLRSNVSMYVCMHCVVPFF